MNVKVYLLKKKKKIEIVKKKDARNHQIWSSENFHGIEKFFLKKKTLNGCFILIFILISCLTSLYSFTSQTEA